MRRSPLEGDFSCVLEVEDLTREMEEGDLSREFEGADLSEVLDDPDERKCPLVEARGVDDLVLLGEGTAAGRDQKVSSVFVFHQYRFPCAS